MAASPFRTAAHRGGPSETLFAGYRQGRRVFAGSQIDRADRPALDVLRLQAPQPLEQVGHLVGGLEDFLREGDRDLDFLAAYLVVFP